MWARLEGYGRQCWRFEVPRRPSPSSALHLADATGEPLELALTLPPALQRRDDQVAILLLAHHQVSSADVVHLLANTLQAVFEQQRRLPQVSLRHAVQLVYSLALGFGDDLRVAIHVGDLLDLDLQS